MCFVHGLSAQPMTYTVEKDMISQPPAASFSLQELLKPSVGDLWMLLLIFIDLGSLNTALKTPRCCACIRWHKSFVDFRVQACHKKLCKKWAVPSNRGVECNWGACCLHVVEISKRQRCFNSMRVPFVYDPLLVHFCIFVRASRRQIIAYAGTG